MGKETILYMYIKNKILIQNCVLAPFKNRKKQLSKYKISNF